MRSRAPGQANLSMSTAQLAERFGAVSMTLEMPFKDNADLPDPVYGWSPDRCRLLARACLDALHAMIDRIAEYRGKADAATLVLIRHGQSAWNLENRFTGWWDVGLTPQGEEEAKAAGELLAAKGFDFDLCFTCAADPGDQDAAHRARGDGPAVAAGEKHWRLNERHYGGLTGLDKAETRPSTATSRSRSGAARSTSRRRRWSRAATSTSPTTAAMPASPSRRTRASRTRSRASCLIGRSGSRRRCRTGERVLISAHGNSLRALVKHLSGIADDEIVALEIPTGQPIVYELDEDAERRSSAII